jgi:NHL repeat-containing protein
MGVITRVAGTGTRGNSGDDGPATNAELNLPAGVAVTADGGFLIADSGNNVVRKVSSAGVITRVAGTGTRVTAAMMVQPPTRSSM